MDPGSEQALQTAERSGTDVGTDIGLGASPHQEQGKSVLPTEEEGTDRVSLTTAPAPEKKGPTTDTVVRQSSACCNSVPYLFDL